ncbi:class I SAM-dependent methyltransferase [Myxococcota bacterium]|nr:class I SAM-dependent methyltransferase [Myxococcota bacterium]MBU1432023.1 class I SAM-dependent methyltransferase [Myxococcota bacterium]
MFNAAAEAAGLAARVDEARLAAFFELRARWAKTHNLSGPQALSAPLTDWLDACAVWPNLRDDLELIDVGSGSGVPGLCLACLEPERPIHLIEPSVKRVAFLKSAIYQLGLKATRVTRACWPLTPDRPAQVISRAVVDPARWPDLALEGGEAVEAVLRMLAAKRPTWSPTRFALAAALDYDLPGHGARRVERWDRG